MFTSREAAADLGQGAGETTILESESSGMGASGLGGVKMSARSTFRLLSVNFGTSTGKAMSEGEKALLILLRNKIEERKKIPLPEAVTSVTAAEDSDDASSLAVLEPRRKVHSATPPPDSGSQEAQQASEEQHRLPVNRRSGVAGISTRYGSQKAVREIISPNNARPVARSVAQRFPSPPQNNSYLSRRADPSGPTKHFAMRRPAVPAATRSVAYRPEQIGTGSTN
eukprot:284815459_1